MIWLSEFIVNFLVNASWQIPAIALLTLILARVLRNGPARYRHALWMTALLLCLAVPLLTLFRGRIDLLPDLASSERETATSSSIAARTSQPSAEAFFQSPAASRNANALIQKRQSVYTNGAITLALTVLYFLFFLYRSFRLLRSWRATQRLRRSVYSRPLPSNVRAVSKLCCEKLEINRVRIVFSPLTATPVTIGLLRPLVILPESFSSQYPDEILVSVLGHEMGHIQRRDFGLNVFCEALMLFVSFHPLVRLIKHQIDRTRELACDEIVTQTLLKPETHARSLVQIATALIAPANRALTVGIFDASTLEERIMKLTSKSRRRGVRAARLIAFFGLSLFLIFALTISTFSIELHTTTTGPNAGRDRSRRDSAAVMSENAGLSLRFESFEPDGAASDANQDPTRKGLDSSDATERANAACLAGHQRDLQAISQLISLLSDDSKTELIQCWRTGRWSPALSSFKQPSPGEQAAIALASMGSPAFKSLTAALASGDSTVRRNAAWAIGELTGMPPTSRDEAVLPLISLLSDEDSWVRMAAARALGELRDERSSERLIAALNDSAQGVRLMSAWALGEMKDKAAVTSLCNVLVSDAQSEVRLAAAEALGEIRSPNAMMSLNQALNDSEPRVRVKARWAISEIKDIGM